MKVGEILRDKQNEVFNKLNKQPKSHKKTREDKRKNNKESLSLSDIEKMMKHDSYFRGKGGAIKQKI